MWQFITIFFCSTLSPIFDPSCQISLEGIHRFCVEDDISFASPDFDDCECRQIQVPGSWQSQKIPSSTVIGWYRISFDTKVRLKQPAVILGRIGNADEVFLNGIKIGGEGMIGNQFTEIEFNVRLYRMPPDLLNYEKPNLLSIRVMNSYRSGGLLDGPVCIGEYSDLIVQKQKQESVRKYVEIFFFVFYTLSLTACIILYFLDIRDMEYPWFSFFIALYLALITFNSLIFYEIGLKTPFIQRTINACSALLPLPVLMFIFHISKHDIPTWIRGLKAAYVIIALWLMIRVQIFFSTL